MGRTPDAAEGPRIDEEAIVWREETSDPSEARRLQFVQNKGMEIFEDGVVRGVGESRVNIHQYPVDDRDVDSPPGSPSTGYRVIVGDSPTGDFVGHAGEIAQYNGSAWVFTTPQHGMKVYVRDEEEPYKQVASSTPWIWDRVYAEKYREKNDSELTTNSSTWLVHLRLPASGTLDLINGNYEIFGNILAYGTNPACEIGLRLREDGTTTICENIVLPQTTGDAKQPCLARDWLDSLSGGHYYTLEFNKNGGAGVAKVSHSRLSLQRLENG